MLCHHYFAHRFGFMGYAVTFPWALTSMLAYRHPLANSISPATTAKCNSVQSHLVTARISAPVLSGRSVILLCLDSIEKCKGLNPRNSLSEWHLSVWNLHIYINPRMQQRYHNFFPALLYWPYHFQSKINYSFMMRTRSFNSISLIIFFTSF